MDEFGWASAVNAVSQRLSDLLAHPHVDRWREAKILACIEDCSDDDLNDLLLGVSLKRLFSVVDDHFGGPQHFSHLVGLLSVERLASLQVPAKAQIIDALQLSSNHRDSMPAATGLLLSEQGGAFTALKNLIDTSGDYRDLQYLVFRLFNPDQRTQTLQHIAQQAVLVPEAGRKSISDIDDTLYASLHDRRFPRGRLYPGVIPYHQAILGSQNPGEGELVLITARPQVPGHFLENATHQQLRSKGIGFRSTILSGSLRALGSHKQMAAKKRQNFHQYRCLFPEYRFIFTGDSGQGDAEFASMLMQEYPRQVEATLIHDVVQIRQPQRRFWEQRGVYFFDSYPGAAYYLLDQGMIEQNGMERVAKQTRAELKTGNFYLNRGKSSGVKLVQRDLAQSFHALRG